MSQDRPNLIKRRNLILLNQEDPATIFKKEKLKVAKIQSDELSLLESHAEAVREARIKLMGVLETYIKTQNMPLREAVITFAKANMWPNLKAARYLYLMSELESPFKQSKFVREFEGA